MAPFTFSFQAMTTILAFLCCHSVTAMDLNPHGCSFDDMEAFYMEELGIEGVEVLYETRRMENPNVRGFARQLGKNLYHIALQEGLEPSEKRITLAHELVHVRQLENGQIKKSEFEKHYLDRSFEDEAFRLSMPMAIKFYTEHRCEDPETATPTP